MELLLHILAFSTLTHGKSPEDISALGSALEALCEWPIEQLDPLLVRVFYWETYDAGIQSAEVRMHQQIAQIAGRRRWMHQMLYDMEMGIDVDINKRRLAGDPDLEQWRQLCILPFLAYRASAVQGSEPPCKQMGGWVVLNPIVHRQYFCDKYIEFKLESVHL